MESDNEFFEKNVVITGASSGIGQSVAIYFLNCGANVVLAGQDKDSMLTMCNKFGFKNGTVMTFDLIEDTGIYDFKTAVVESLNKVDILITCHGILLDGDVERTFPQDFDYSLDINLRSVFLLTKYLSPFLNEGASVINMSCLYGTRPCTGMIGQAMSKAGLELLTRYLAAELSQYNVRVNAVSSCPVDTNALARIKVSDGEISLMKQKMENYVPMGRIAKPDDIARVIAFLASEKSKCITGQVIKVDGGRNLTSSGYVHYKGMKNMNSRFEPDGVKIGTWINGWKNKILGEKSVFPIEDLPKISKFVDEKIQESNFSTNLSDAHLSILAGYKFVDINDDKLKMKFPKDNTTTTPGYAFDKLPGRNSSSPQNPFNNYYNQNNYGSPGYNEDNNNNNLINNNEIIETGNNDINNNNYNIGNMSPSNKKNLLNPNNLNNELNENNKSDYNEDNKFDLNNFEEDKNEDEG